MEKNLDRFLSALATEKLKAQERRGELIAKKLAWVTGLFALGAVKLPLPVESRILLFFVPVVSLVYDLYILGENYGIKRMGSFVRQKHPASVEAEWEAWLPARRDRYSWYALSLSSWIILLACTIVLSVASQGYLGIAVWFVSLASFMVWLFRRAGFALKSLDDEGRD